MEATREARSQKNVLLDGRGHLRATGADVVLDGSVKEAAILGLIPNVPREIVRRQFAYGRIVNKNLPFAWLKDSGDETKERGLSRSRRSGNADHLAGVYGEVDRAEDGLGVLDQPAGNFVEAHAALQATMGWKNMGRLRLRQDQVKFAERGAELAITNDQRDDRGDVRHGA